MEQNIETGRPGRGAGGGSGVFRLDTIVRKPLTTKAEVERYFSGEKIECLICGKLFMALATHLIRVHSMDVDEYKEMFNLPWGHGLVCSATKRKQANALKKRIDNGEKSLQKTKKMHNDIVKKACAVKKRPFRNYQIDRLIDDGNKIRAAQKEKTKKLAIRIIEEMERKKLPLCHVCCQPGQAGMSVLYSACKYYPKVKKKYKEVKALIRKK